MYARCMHGHNPDKVIVFLPDELDPDGIGVLLDGHGNTTNQWADGTVGIGRERTMAAIDEDSAYCPDHLDEVRWIHD